MAQAFKKVIALEPNPYSAQQLIENVEGSGLNNVAVWNVGAAYVSGMRMLSEIDGTPSRSTLYPEFASLPRSRQFWSYFLRLDEYFNEADAIKIDTEGSEYEVLKGAGKIISKGAAFCIETHSDVLYKECAGMLQKKEIPFRTMILEEEAPESIHALENKKHKYLVRINE